MYAAEKVIDLKEYRLEQLSIDVLGVLVSHSLLYNETKNGEWLPRFTCEISYQQLSEVCVYSMVRCDNRTKNISVPFITIADAVEPGEELILEISGKAKEKRKAITQCNAYSPAPAIRYNGPWREQHEQRRRV